MMLSSAARHLTKRTTGFSGIRSMATLSGFEDFGKSVFTGSVAEDYLSKYGETKALLDDPNWVTTHSDTVAKAVFDWYVLSCLLACFLLNLGYLGWSCHPL